MKSMLNVKIPGLVNCLALLCTLMTQPAFAQDLPSTQIWLMPLIQDQPGEPKRISPVAGYHNQPHFSPDSRTMYYTSEQADGQTDVWLYEISSGERKAINASSESEYSPTPIPGGNAVSVVRVEADQRQRLWSIDIEDGAASLLLPDIEPVGYHAWMNERTVVLFILGESMTLHKARIGDDSSTLMADNIGRTLRRHPVDGTALYVSKTRQPWWISAMNPDSGESTQVMPLFPNVEDFEVDSQGRFWTGSGSKLYRSRSDNTQWNMLADLKDFGLKNISRLAISPDGQWLAVVVSP